MRAWKVLGRRVLLSRPPWIEVGVERVELPDGRVVEEFLWVQTRDFAMTVAVTPNGHVVLERSYKHGPRRVALSLPAGYVEPGELPEQAARRTSFSRVTRSDRPMRLARVTTTSKRSRC